MKKKKGLCATAKCMSIRCLSRKHRWPIFVMLMFQRLCVEQASPACFSNSPPLFASFALWFVWLPLCLLKTSRVLQEFVTCNFPLADWSSAKNTEPQMVSFLVSLVHKHDFSSEFFPSVYTFFYLIFIYIFFSFLINTLSVSLT